MIEIKDSQNISLKLKDDKTEYLRFLPHHKDRSSTTPITIGTESIDTSSSAKNLGVIFRSNLSLLSHINTIMKAAYFQLHKISRVKRYLTPQALRIAVHALISSKIYYCNSLLFGLPKYETNKFQNIMNSAARMIHGSNKFCHITPLLKELHWLPVEFRICFKILCLTYKAINGLSPTYLAEQIL